MPCVAKQTARAARFRAIRRKNPPCNSLISTLIQTRASSKKIASASRAREFGTHGAIARGICGQLENYSSPLLPNRRILASKEWSEAACSAGRAGGGVHDNSLERKNPFDRI